MFDRTSPCISTDFLIVKDTNNMEYMGMLWMFQPIWI
jgi:hypothetical protein